MLTRRRIPPKQFTLATEIGIVRREPDRDIQQGPEFQSGSRRIALFLSGCDCPEHLVSGFVLQPFPVGIPGSMTLFKERMDVG